MKSNLSNQYLKLLKKKMYEDSRNIRQPNVVYINLLTIKHVLLF